MGKIGVALVNLGTPDSTDVSDVKKYLLEFLLDKRVIDTSSVTRNLLVRALIVPRRKKFAASLYQQLPDLPDLPLRYFGNLVKEQLSEKLGKGFDVKLAMRYGSPSFSTLLDQWKVENKQAIVLVPLFPQYASATTGSILEQFFSHLKDWNTIPKIHIVRDFFSSKGFLDAQVAVASKVDLSTYDHFVFSYHGLPVRQLKKANMVGAQCKACDSCCVPFKEANQHCYRAQCLETTRLIVDRLGLDKKRVTTSFQSRLGKTPWIKPYTEDTVQAFAKKYKKVAVFSPSFVSDCLETWIEVETEYRELFCENGGEKLDLVPSLNDHPLWVQALKEMVLNQLQLSESKAASKQQLNPV